MFKPLIATIVISLAASASGGDRLLSPPSSWGDDFTVRSPPTDVCPGGTISHLRARMAVSEPKDLAVLRERFPDTVLSQISQDDRLYTFQFSTDPDSGNFWGFSGYLVARGNCIVHAEVTGHDN